MEKGEKVAIIAIAVNVVLLIIKYIFARLSGSIALMADVIHSSSDVVAALMVFAGLKISKRKSKNFPYGLYKVENFVSILISVAIVSAGYEIVKEAFFSGGERAIQNIPITIVGVIVVIGITLALGQYQIKVGREINSPSIEADGHHARTDTFSSVVVLLSLIGKLAGLKIDIDKFAPGVIVLFIAYAGIEIFIHAIRVLLDASIDFETLDKAKGIILSEPTVREIKSLMGRNSGSYKFIEAEITLNLRDLEKAYFISERIEKKLRKEISHIDHVLIHYEPIQKPTITYAIPLDTPDGVISKHLGEAPFFGLYTVDAQSKHLVNQEILSNSFLSQDKGKGIVVAEMLVQRGCDVVLTTEPFTGRGPSYVFSDAGVQIEITEKKSAKEVLEKYGVSLENGR